MTQSDERIAALEAQIATLEQRVTGSDVTPAVDRRAMLRRGGAVLAGAAGALALPGMVSGASAASGGNFVLGMANDSQGNQSSLTAATSTTASAPTTLATLSVANTSTTTANNVNYGNPQLRLVPPTASTTNGSNGQPIGPYSTNPASTVTGDLFASTSTTTGSTAIASDLVYTHSQQFTYTPSGSTTSKAYPAVIGAVYTSAFHNVLVPVVDNNTSSSSSLPQARVIDTRPTSVSGRSSNAYNKVTPAASPGIGSSQPTSQNTTLADGTIARIIFTPSTSTGSFLTPGGALYAVGGNLTVTNGTSPGGYVSALATAHTTDVSGSPKTANLLVPVNGAASNFVIVPCGVGQDSSGATFYFFDLIIKSTSCHLIFDVTALWTSDTTDVRTSAQPGYTGSIQKQSASIRRAGTV